jgi:hypothetical protein
VPEAERLAWAEKRMAWYAEQIDIHLEAIRAQAEQIATLQAEKERWRSAAFYKIRTWDALQGMHRAGDSVEYIAEQYGVPVQWVEFVMFPENDLDARYARPSDRTKTAKADRDAALQELKALRAENARLKAEHAK